MGKNWQPLSEDGGADIGDLGGEHVPKYHSRLAVSQVLEKPSSSPFFVSLDYYRLFFHEAAGRKIWLRVGKFLIQKSPQSPQHLSFFVQLEVYLSRRVHISSSHPKLPL